jgi:hypothetical protein
MSNSIKCKYCGAEIPYGSKCCPNCNKKNGNLGKKLLIALIVFFVLVSVGRSLPSKKQSSGNHSSDQSVNTSGAEAVSEADFGEKQVVLVDDECIKAECIRVEDFPELGAFSVYLRVTNKTDQTIWVCLEEASVNDEMMNLVMSGTPLYILPEKMGTNGFLFYFAQISIDSFDDVESISFKIVVRNKDTFENVETTPEVTIAK